MSKILGKWLDSTAKEDVLKSKLVALRNGVLTKNVNGGSSTVTTEVLAAASTDTPVTALTALGIYTGAVSGANDPKRVLVRAAGTDNGIDDGSGDDVYGILTEAAGVYTLTFKKADGSGFTFGVATDIDFYFVEVFNEYNKPTDAYLNTVIGGVVDASTADVALAAKNSIDTHLNGGASKHDANEIDYERLDANKKNIAAASDDTEAAISDLDDAIGALDATPSNYTPANPAIVADHLAAIDSALSAAGGTSFDDSTFEIKDNAAPTKVMKFEVSGVTAGQTRTVTMADRAVNLANVSETKTEELTLNGTDITNKYKDLVVAASVKDASTVQLFPVGGLEQNYGEDFTVITDGTYIRRINWDGLGMDGVLTSGDKLRVQYRING